MKNMKNNSSKPGVGCATSGWTVGAAFIAAVILAWWLLVGTVFARQQEDQNVGAFVYADIDHDFLFSEGDVPLGGQTVELVEFFCPLDDADCVEGTGVQEGVTDASGDVLFTITRGNRFVMCYSQGGIGCVLVPEGYVLQHFGTQDWEQVFLPIVATYEKAKAKAKAKAKEGTRRNNARARARGCNGHYGPKRGIRRRMWSMVLCDEKRTGMDFLWHRTTVPGFFNNIQQSETIRNKENERWLRNLHQNRL